MDRLFGTDGIRGRVNEYPMTADIALRLGLAAATYFRGNTSRKRKVIIGKDTRLSGYVFEAALTAGFCAAGMDVYQVGPMPTPALAFLTRNMRADLGVVISASHNSYEDNGIKFFDSVGYKLPDDVEDKITELALGSELSFAYPESSEIGRAKKIFDAPGRYIVFIKNSFPQELTLSGLRVVIDCANGANYKIAPLALEELGAEVIALNTAPNGLNINHQCGSLYPQKVQEKVFEVRADIGIALDGDADRLIVVDEKGQVLDGDQLMALCAQDLMEKGQLNNNTLVTTSMSNMALEVFMQERGGTLLRTNVGDRYVMEAMRKHNASLGGEQSGHIIFHNYSTTGDGLLAALQILRIMQEKQKPLSELAGQLRLYPQKMINVSVEKKPPLEEIPSLQKALADAEEKLGTKGRVVVRYSGTENLCRVMVEAQDPKLVESLCQSLADEVKKNIGGK